MRSALRNRSPQSKKIPGSRQTRAAAFMSSVDPLCPRFGVRVRVRVRDWVGSLPAYLDLKKYLNTQPNNLKVLSPRLYWDLFLFSLSLFSYIVPVGRVVYWQCIVYSA